MIMRNRRGDKNVYTPQMIINGGSILSEADTTRISSAIAAARVEDTADWIDIAMTDNKTDIIDHHPGRRANKESNPLAHGICALPFN